MRPVLADKAADDRHLRVTIAVRVNRHVHAARAHVRVGYVDPHRIVAKHLLQQLSVERGIVVARDDTCVLAQPSPHVVHLVQALVPLVARATLPAGQDVRLVRTFIHIGTREQLALGADGVEADHLEEGLAVRIRHVQQGREPV